MAGLYIPLNDLDPNQSHQHTSNDNIPPKNSNPITKAINNAHSFRFKQHNLILFCKTFVRCLATIALIAFVLATLKIYQNKGNFTSHQKTSFNVIITALGLCLGLNFFVSHTSYAQRNI